MKRKRRPIFGAPFFVPERQSQTCVPSTLSSSGSILAEAASPILSTPRSSSSVVSQFGSISGTALSSSSLVGGGAVPVLVYPGQCHAGARTNTV